MLRISGMYDFFYISNFHDMRCKYDRVLSVIHQQMDREPMEGEIYIMMSKDKRIVRLYHYDRRSCSLHEKRFRPGYQFMKIEREGSQTTYNITWEDVVLLLESPVIKTLKIK